MSDAPARRTGRPTLNEAATLQQTILDETLGMIGAAGIEGFSVDQLATRIGVTKRTIYRHYRNKNGLIIAVVSREVDRLIHKVDQESKVDTDKSANSIIHLRTWIKSFFDYVGTPQATTFLNFLIFESASNAEISLQFFKWHNHVMAYCCSLIEDAQICGLIRSGNTQRFALLLLDLIIGMQNRIRLDFNLEDAFGGDDPEKYFEFRWMGFLSLVSDHPWASFISLAKDKS